MSSVSIGNRRTVCSSIAWEIAIGHDANGFVVVFDDDRTDRFVFERLREFGQFGVSIGRMDRSRSEFFDGHPGYYSHGTIFILRV